MSFKEKLLSKNLGHLLTEHTFRKIVPQNSAKFAATIKRIVDENIKVYIDPDCDPDGYFSAKIMQTMFDILGYSNYVIGRHTVKRHTLSMAYTASLLREGFGAVMLLDSSSNSMDIIKYISERDVICICVDHHTPDYKFSDYPESAVIVNPKIDALYVNECIYDQLSAGALCALLCDYTLQTQFHLAAPREVYLYGVITLYSDICTMNNAYNVAYVTQFQNTQIIDSPLIKLFWDFKYSHFDRNYISFNLVPKLNSLMRMEKFDLLYSLFFEENQIDFSEMSAKILAIHADCKEHTAKLINRCTVEQNDLFAVAYMPTDVVPLDRNFTGLIANHFASSLNQPVICLFPQSPMVLGGSVRDPFSRNLLSLFKTVCYAAGHDAAFGVSVNRVALPTVLTALKNAKDFFNEINDNVIMCNWNNKAVSKEDLLAEMQLMANYNEFGGQGLPKAIGFITVPNNARIFRNDSYTAVYFDGFKFTCFTTAVDIGDTLLVSPTLAGSSYQLLVNNISYSNNRLS